MREESEGIEAVVDGNDDDVGNLVDPAIKRPVSRITFGVAFKME